MTMRLSGRDWLILLIAIVVALGFGAYLLIVASRYMRGFS